MEIKRVTRSVLGATGLLEPVRRVRRDVTNVLRVRESDRYLSQLVALHKNELSRGAAALEDGWTEDLHNAEAERVARRFEDDQRSFTAAMTAYLCVKTSAGAVTPENAARALEATARQGLAGDVVRALSALLSSEGAALTSKVKALVDGHTEPRRVTFGHDDDSARVALVRIVLDRVCEDGLFPHAFEYDFLDDIVPIVSSRYVDYAGARREWSRALLACLVALLGGHEETKTLSERLRTCLGPNHPYVPRKGEPHPWLRQVVPDLYDELVALRGRDDAKRLLEIGREYSYRQRSDQGTWGHRLSFLVGYERDHQLMLRKLIDLKTAGSIGPADEILAIGPRHRDEIHFFRHHLGLPKTIGLDLFEAPKDGIEAGDMHEMSYASGRFRLVYACATLTYSYDIRKCIAAISRVLARPGYVIISDSAGRKNGVDVLGRTDWRSAEALAGSFYEGKMSIVFRDEGRPPSRDNRAWPSVCVRLD